MTRDKASASPARSAVGSRPSPTAPPRRRSHTSHHCHLQHHIPPNLTPPSPVTRLLSGCWRAHSEHRGGEELPRGPSCHDTPPQWEWEWETHAQCLSTPPTPRGNTTQPPREPLWDSPPAAYGVSCSLTHPSPTSPSPPRHYCHSHTTTN